MIRNSDMFCLEGLGTTTTTTTTPTIPFKYAGKGQTD